VTFPVAQYFQPLCPLDRPTDEERYLAIDSSVEMFTEFTDSFDNPADWMASGHLIVVTGDRGYGKTSLIQRCAYWLKSQQQQVCEMVVLDLSAENWPPEAEDERIKRTFGRIIDKLRASLPDEEISKLKGHLHDINDSFYYLGQALKTGQSSVDLTAQSIALVVLLPSYPTASEVTRYYNLACPGTFFFAEIYDVEDTRKVKSAIPSFNTGRTDIHHLAMSVLKSGDAKLIAAWIRNERPGQPELSNRVVRDRLESLIKQRKISVSELNRLAWGVLRFAAREAADRVTDKHFAQYYEELVFPDPA
jgi:GTPase SAR1 family protein